MKKLAFAIAAVAAIGLAGCHKNDGDAANNTATVTEMNTTDNQAVVDVNTAAADAALGNAGNAVDNAADSVAHTADAAVNVH